MRTDWRNGEDQYSGPFPKLKQETNMTTKCHNAKELREVRQRAADIRRNWSPLEKIRRTGLPPDTPARLRQFILGETQFEWATVGNGRGH
jgi:hypothetical protein